MSDPRRTQPDAELATLRADPELARIFLSETFDHLSSVEPSVLALEMAPDDERVLNEVFRPFHTIKGNAGALGIASVEELAHRVEDLLDRARSGEHGIGAVEIELILTSVDLLTHMIRDVEGRLAGRGGGDYEDRRLEVMAAIHRLVGGAPGSGEAGANAFSPCGDRTRPQGDTRSGVANDGPGTIKVDMRKLDSLVDLIGELAIVQSMIRQDPRLLGYADERLNRNLTQLGRITSELQRGAISMRVVPVRQMFQRMRRLVRDLGQKSGKALELVVSGEDTEIDRKVVEEIGDPLMHMLRNSVDHGIEDAEARRRAGKPPQGQLSLSAYHEGGNVVIAVADDGCGLDTEKLYRRAMAQALVTPDAPMLEADIHALIFRPGFSTASEVTEISGRGIGMDVVHRNVERLRGRIEIQSRPGLGATFLIKLPLTLATLEGLLLSVAGQRFVLPTFAVRESFRPSSDQAHVIPGRGRIVRVRDELLPFVRLADLFKIPGAASDPTQAVVTVLEDGPRRLGLMVDQLVGEQEIVIKSLGDALVNITGVAGGAILADGRVGLILDARGLIGLAERDMSYAA